MRSMLTSALVAAGFLAAPAMVPADVFDTYGGRFVDDQWTGGLYHFDEVYISPGGDTRLFIDDDNSVTDRPRRLMVLRNDGFYDPIFQQTVDGPQTVTGTGYWDAGARADVFLKQNNDDFSLYFDTNQPANVVMETIITMPQTIRGRHPNFPDDQRSMNQTLANLSPDSFWWRLIPQQIGAEDGIAAYSVPALAIWQESDGAANDLVWGAMHLLPGESYYLRAEYDSDGDELRLTVNDQTLTKSLGGELMRPVGEALFLGIRSFHRFHGQMHEFKVSMLPDDIPTLPGDANRDGRVDGEDFLIWQASFGMQEGATWDDGDFNGDGRVDGEDFLIWQAHFGSVAGSNAVTPEPAALSLPVLAGAGLMARRRRV